MKAHLFYIIALLGLLFLSGCEETIDLNTEFTKKPVIISEITPNLPIIATVGYSRPALSTSPTTYVNNASVQIYNEDLSNEILLYFNQNEDPSFNEALPLVPYYSSDTYININNNRHYTIQVDIPGEDRLIGKTFIPEKTDIDYLTTTNLSVLGDSSENVYSFTANTHFKHIDPNKKYHFLIKFVYNVINENNDTTLIQTIGQIERTDINVPYTKDFANGLLINGDDIAPDTWIRSSLKMSVFFDEEASILNPLALAELRSVSDEYFDYHYSLSRFKSQDDSLFVQPIVIPSNIDNGLGIFAGYDYTTAVAILER